VTGECLDASEKGQQLRGDHKLVEARAQLARCVRDICPRLVRKDCLEVMDQVKTSLSSIVLAVRDTSGRDVPDVRVVVDGKVVAESLDGRAILVDPGVHQLRLEPARAAAVEQSIVLREGEKNRLVTLELPVTTSRTDAVDEPVRTDSVPSARRRAAFVVAGASVLALGVGAAFGAIAIHERERSDRECPNDNCSALGVSYNDQAITAAWFADFGIGLGLVGAAVATYLFVTGASPPPATARLHVAPGGLGVGGSF
jgi:hypothetical protein